MKCYKCGTSEPNHTVACPEFSLKNEIKSDFIPHYDRVFPKTKEIVKPYTSFMPLEHQSVAGNSFRNSRIPETVTIYNQPHVACRIHRLWIDETIAEYFTIHSIRITHNERLVCGGAGRVFANLFRSGRWPLTTQSDAVFGIVFSGWGALTPAHRVSIEIENIDISCHPFRGCFELLCGE